MEEEIVKTFTKFLHQRKTQKRYNKKQGKNEELFNELGEHVEDCLNDNIPLTMINF